MAAAVEHAWKKGSAELLILYPLLYRLEKRGWIEGRWVEKANQRLRRYYRLTTEGRRVLAAKRQKWQEFAGAVGRIAGVEHA